MVEKLPGVIPDLVLFGEQRRPAQLDDVLGVAALTGSARGENGSDGATRDLGDAFEFHNPGERPARYAVILDRGR